MKTIGYAKSTSTTIKCDGYHPLVVQIGEESDPSPNYWRTGDFDRSLLQVAVDNDSGRILCVDLVIAGREFRTENGPFPRVFQQEIIEGVPTADSSMWLDDAIRVDVHQPIYPVLYSDAFSVAFGQPEIVPSLTARSDRVDFYLNENSSLIGFAVRGITPEEHSGILLGTRDSR